MYLIKMMCGDEILLDEDSNTYKKVYRNSATYKILHSNHEKYVLEVFLRNPFAASYKKSTIFFNRKKDYFILKEDFENNDVIQKLYDKEPTRDMSIMLIKTQIQQVYDNRQSL